VMPHPRASKIVAAGEPQIELSNEAAILPTNSEERQAR
jgi:hypothetical protein